MRKILMILLMIATLAGIVPPATAELYFDQEPPADWETRTDIMRLTAFRTLINDCTLLEVGGRSMLIDGGVRKWRHMLRDALKELGYDGHVDILFNTHPHDDHLEGVYYLIREGFIADEFWSAFPPNYQNEMQQKTMAELTDKGIPFHQLRQMEEANFGGAKLVFYWWKDGNDPNELSVVMHITYGNATVLMAADIGGKAEIGLLEYVPPELMRADILKYPHHGILPAQAAFIDAVKPSFVFVSNFRPKIPRVVEQLDRQGIVCWGTTYGRVVMMMDGTDWYINHYKDMF